LPDLGAACHIVLMRPWLISLAALGLALALPPLAKSRGLAKGAATGAVPALAITPIAAPPASAPPDVPLPPQSGRGLLAGLDLVHIGLDDEGASAPADGRRIAHLTLDPDLQTTARSILSSYRLPEAAIVMLDPETGEVLAYASHVEQGEPRDLCVEATAPAASVFKIVTASALVETAGLSPDTRQCYSGGEQRILSSDLVDDPLRDRWCVTIAGAMGRSVNAVFARLAQKHLTPAVLEETARSLGFGEPIPFDVPVAPSAITVPHDGLGFARTAAGFWNTTLSPLHAAWVSAAIERGGESVRPYIVREIQSPDGPAIRIAPTKTSRRVVTPAAAEALTTMLEHTVSEGTSFRAFHDAKGAPFLPSIIVAGKTGTLSDDRAHHFYTWFTGFAPSHPVEGVRPIAIAVLVVNDPTWRVKANVVAREMLQAYFASRKAAGVAYPKIEKVATADR
jgi:cell division protein FtsI/penicillin-binding protein 2